MAVARRSIEHGLATGRPLPIVPSEYHRDLKAVRASFVTLQLRGQLRGCIGHLEAVQPLVVDVSENAFAAAFQDPRFNPLTAQEWPSVDIHLSLLTRPEPMRFQDEADLVRQIQPGVDGLILQDGPNRGPSCHRCGKACLRRQTSSVTSSSRPACLRTTGPGESRCTDIAPRASVRPNSPDRLTTPVYRLSQLTLLRPFSFDWYSARSARSTRVWGDS